MSKIKFKEDTHQYLSDSGELISVSAFVHKFEPVKDWKAIAKKASNNLKKYKGIIKSPDELLKEWDNKKVLGSQAGTIVHKIKEDEKGGREYKHVYEEGCKVSKDLTTLEQGIHHVELMIYMDDICGQSDDVFIENDYIFIYDTKTDKSIDFKGFSSEWTKAEKFLEPVSHLDVCNGNLYSLKMSMYMYMLWKANKGRLKPGKIILEWCPIERDEDGIPILYDGVPKILFQKDIEIPYRKKEVMAMIEHYKNNK